MENLLQHIPKTIEFKNRLKPIFCIIFRDNKIIAGYSCTTLDDDRVNYIPVHPDYYTHIGNKLEEVLNEVILDLKNNPNKYYIQEK